MTGLKSAGRLCRVVPVMHPALGAVVGLLNLSTDFDNDPWKTIIGAVDIAKAYGDQMASEVAGAASLLARKVDPISGAFVAKESAAALQGWISALMEMAKRKWVSR